MCNVDAIEQEPLSAPQTVRRRRTRLAQRKHQDPRRSCSRWSCARWTAIINWSPASAVCGPPGPPACHRCRCGWSISTISRSSKPPSSRTFSGSDLNPIEKAQGFKDYLDRFQMTHEQLAARLGLARSTIYEPGFPAGTTRRSAGSRPRRPAHRPATPSSSRASTTATSRPPWPRRSSPAACRSTRRKRTSSKVQPNPPPPNRVRRRRAAPADPEKTAHVQGLEDEIRQKLGLRVEIRVKGKDRGQIVLAFESNDDFERLLEVLRRPPGCVRPPRRRKIKTQRGVAQPG